MARRRDDDDDDDDDVDVRKRRRNDDDDDDDDDRPRSKKASKKPARKSGDGVPIGDYLFFRKMIGPPLFTGIFLVGVTYCLTMSISYIMRLFASTELDPGGRPLPSFLTGPSKLESSLWALFYLIGGPLIVRGFCEGLACLVRIADSLDAQKKPAEGEVKKEPEKKAVVEDDEDDEE